MAEEKFDQSSRPVPLAESDLSPIKPLTASNVLKIAQRYIEASFANRRFNKIIAQATGDIDEEVIMEFHYEAGQADAFRKVLKMVGQDNLVSKVNKGLDQVIEQP